MLQALSERAHILTFHIRPCECPVSNFQQMIAIPDVLVTKPIKVNILCVLESWNEMVHYNHTPNSGLCSFTMSLYSTFCHRIQ